MLCFCSKCNKNGESNLLVQVHVKSWNETFGPDGTVTASLKVCRECLIGHNVPVRRPSTGSWEFGIVQSYDESMKRHQVLFLDEEKEWVQVKGDPFNEYIHHFLDIPMEKDESLENLNKEPDKVSLIYNVLQFGNPLVVSDTRSTGSLTFCYTNLSYPFVESHDSFEGRTCTFHHFSAYPTSQ
jgi:hypothetical protein